MAAGSRGSRPAPKRAGGRVRTALAAAGAAACVVATASASLPVGVQAAPGSPTSQPANELAASARPGAASALPAAFVRPSATPTLPQTLRQLAGAGARTADASPSWTGDAGREASGAGVAQARRLSADVLHSTAPSTIRASALGIPGPVLSAYHHAADVMAQENPRCGVSWWLLAGIGRIESGHASGGRVDADGTTLGRILGPRLDGSMAGNAVIHDSDGGVFDGDPHYDRAVGPMQFLPGTWASVRSDGNGDGVTDPNNVYDATLGAARYLCSVGADLRTPAGLSSAVLRYNNSMAYVRSVLSWGQAYRDGDTQSVPRLPGRVPAATTPRQIPDEPPRSEHPAKRSAKPHATTQPDQDRARRDVKDQPPVLADGPRGSESSGTKQQSHPPASSGSDDATPNPQTTVPPSGRDDQPDANKNDGGQHNGGTSQPSDQTSTPDPGTSTKDPTTPPTSTDPTPTEPPTTDPTPTDPPTTDPEPPAEAPVGDLWTATAKAPTAAPFSVPTSAGTYSVTHTVVADDGTLQREGEEVQAPDGARLWLVAVAPPEEGPTATATLQVGDGQPTQLTGSGTQVFAAAVPDGQTVKLTVANDDGTWTIDVGSGETTTTWAHPATVTEGASSLDSATATAFDGDYAAELNGLQLGEGHRTTASGQTWLVVPYTLASAALDNQSQPAKGDYAAAWAAPAVTVDGQPVTVSTPMTTEGGELTVPVPADASNVKIQVAPQIQVTKEGADPVTASFGPALEATFTIQ